MAGRDRRQPMPSRETGTQMEPETATAAMSAVLARPVMAVSTKFMPIWAICVTSTGRPSARKRRASLREKNLFLVITFRGKGNNRAAPCGAALKRPRRHAARGPDRYSKAWA